MTAELAERLIREELPETALFGLRFRQNAGRRSADAPARPGEADAALAPAAPGQGPAPGRAADSRLSRSCSRPCASAWTTTSTCRASARSSMRSRRGRSGWCDASGEIPSPFTSELIFQFTAAHLYEWDEPKRSDRQPAGSVVSDDLLEPLLRGEARR